MSAGAVESRTDTRHVEALCYSAEEFIGDTLSKLHPRVKGPVDALKFALEGDPEFWAHFEAFGEVLRKSEASEGCKSDDNSLGVDVEYNMASGKLELSFSCLGDVIVRLAEEICKDGRRVRAEVLSELWDRVWDKFLKESLVEMGWCRLDHGSFRGEVADVEEKIPKEVLQEVRRDIRLDEQITRSDIVDGIMRRMLPPIRRIFMLRSKELFDEAVKECGGDDTDAADWTAIAQVFAKKVDPNLGRVDLFWSGDHHDKRIPRRKAFYKKHFGDRYNDGVIVKKWRERSALLMIGQGVQRYMLEGHFTPQEEDEEDDWPRVDFADCLLALEKLPGIAGQSVASSAGRCKDVRDSVRHDAPITEEMVDRQGKGQKGMRGKLTDLIVGLRDRFPRRVRERNRIFARNMNELERMLQKVGGKEQIMLADEYEKSNSRSSTPGTQGHRPRSPFRRAQSPLRSASTPSHPPKLSLHQARNPLHQARNPLHRARSPLHRARSPLAESAKSDALAPVDISAKVRDAEAMEADGRILEALELYQECKSTCTDRKTVLYASVLQRMARIKSARGHSREAKSLINEAKVALKGLVGEDDGDLQCSFLRVSALIVQQSGKLNSARAKLEKALKLSSPHSLERAAILVDLGNILLHYTELDSAKATFEESLRCVSPTASQHLHARASLGLSRVHTVRGEHEEANRHLERAKASARIAGGRETELKADILCSDAEHLWARRHIREAMDGFERARGMAMHVLGSDSPLTVRTVLGLAEANFALDDMKESSRLFEDAKRVLDRTSLTKTDLYPRALQGIAAIKHKHSPSIDSWNLLELSRGILMRFLGKKAELYVLTELKMAILRHTLGKSHGPFTHYLEKLVHLVGARAPSYLAALETTKAI